MARKCPKCNTVENNLDKSFVLKVNVCGHSLCAHCVDTLFARNSGPCPTCGQTLRKNQFWDQKFDDPKVDKEVYIRKKFAKIFCLKEQDFASLREFNDYLEFAEDCVWNLINDEHVEETKQRIEQFKSKHASQIAHSRDVRSQDEEWIANQLREDTLYQQRLSGSLGTLKEHFAMAQSEKVESENRQKQVIIDLMKSDQSADLLIARHKEVLKETEQNAAAEKAKKTLPSLFLQREAGQAFGTGNGSGAKVMQHEVYRYEPVLLDPVGPVTPDFGVIIKEGYLRNMKSASVAQSAGGYHAALGCRRALQSAFSGLFDFGGVVKDEQMMVE